MLVRSSSTAHLPKESSQESERINVQALEDTGVVVNATAGPSMKATMAIEPCWSNQVEDQRYDGAITAEDDRGHGEIEQDSNASREGGGASCQDQDCPAQSLPIFSLVTRLSCRSITRKRKPWKEKT